MAQQRTETFSSNPQQAPGTPETTRIARNIATALADLPTPKRRMFQNVFEAMVPAMQTDRPSETETAADVTAGSTTEEGTDISVEGKTKEEDAETTSSEPKKPVKHTLQYTAGKAFGEEVTKSVKKHPDGDKKLGNIRGGSAHVTIANLGIFDTNQGFQLKGNFKIDVTLPKQDENQAPNPRVRPK